MIWPVTPTKKTFLHWMLEDKWTTDIAPILGNRPRTVAKHCQHIYAKLGPVNRMELKTWREDLKRNGEFIAWNL